MPYYVPRTVVVLTTTLDGEGLGGARGRTYSAQVVPRRVEWLAADGRRADEARVEIDQRDLPIDPRAVADARIDIYAADVFDPRVSLTPQRGAARFSGFVDDIESTNGPDGSSVYLRARDFTGRLIDSPFSDAALGVDRPLAQVLYDVISSVPGYEVVRPGGRLIVEGDEGTLARRTGRTQWAPPERNASVWDVVQDMCRTMGLVAAWEIDRLYVRKPQGARIRDRVRMLWGSNVMSLGMKRDLNPAAVRAVMVRAYNDRTRDLIEVRFPEQPRKGEQVAAFQLGGSWSARDMRIYAEAIYRNSERGEFEGRLEASVMEDLDGQDLTAVRGGDTIEVRVRTTDETFTYGYSQSELVAWMSSKGVDEDVAAVLASQWANADRYQPVFFVREARHSIDRDSGYRLSVTFETLLTGDTATKNFNDV